MKHHFKINMQKKKLINMTYIQICNSNYPESENINRLGINKCLANISKSFFISIVIIYQWTLITLSQFSHIYNYKISFACWSMIYILICLKISNVSMHDDPYTKCVNIWIFCDKRARKNHNANGLQNINFVRWYCCCFMHDQR